MLFEDTVGECNDFEETCLNPYSNGICSLSRPERGWWFTWRSVLILILMEYALWDCCTVCSTWWKFCLNPYSNGICSLSGMNNIAIRIICKCLNPYSNGICSLRNCRACWKTWTNLVLILILMEYALWGISLSANFGQKNVLILILMEYALWAVAGSDATITSFVCLNPYSNGICSLSTGMFNYEDIDGES